MSGFVIKGGKADFCDSCGRQSELFPTLYNEAIDGVKVGCQPASPARGYQARPQSPPAPSARSVTSSTFDFVVRGKSLLDLSQLLSKSDLPP